MRDDDNICFLSIFESIPHCGGSLSGEVTMPHNRETVKQLARAFKTPKGPR